MEHVDLVRASHHDEDVTRQDLLFRARVVDPRSVPSPVIQVPRGDHYEARLLRDLGLGELLPGDRRPRRHSHLLQAKLEALP